MTRCLIIGGTGYIGSRLFQELGSRGHAVETVDLEWYGNHVNRANHRVDYRHLNGSLLDWAEAVILLAGHSSVGMAEGALSACFENNVVNLERLLARLRSGQKLIYASSASVYGAAHGISRESDSDFTAQCAYDVSKYMIDLLTPLSGREFYGLRLGTVCGFSPNWRTDVLVNSLFHSAVTDGRVLVFNPQARRSILGLSDLCRAIECIVDCRDDRRGIYNLASCTTTVDEAASTVAGTLGVPREQAVPKLGGATATRYCFHLDCNRFCETFGFTFEQDLGDILSELREHQAQLVPSDRRQHRDYAPSPKEPAHAKDTQ